MLEILYYIVNVVLHYCLLVAWFYVFTTLFHSDFKYEADIRLKLLNSSYFPVNEWVVNTKEYEYLKVKIIASVGLYSIITKRYFKDFINERYDNIKWAKVSFKDCPIAPMFYESKDEAIEFVKSINDPRVSVTEE